MQKFNYDLAFIRYCGGASWQEILADHTHISKQALFDYAKNNEWEARRTILMNENRGTAVENAAKLLAERLANEAIKHQIFMLDNLERQRSLYDMRDHTQDSQASDLGLLDRIDVLARKVHKLDEQKAANPISVGYSVLIQLATSIPPGDKKAPLGILGPNNAYIEGVLEAENSDFGHNGQTGPEDSPKTDDRAITIDEPKKLPPSLFTSGPL